MRDLQMCTSEMCPYRDTCYRKRKKPIENQSYFNYEYTCNENNGFCNYINFGWQIILDNDNLTRKE